MARRRDGARKPWVLGCGGQRRRRRRVSAVAGPCCRCLLQLWQVEMSLAPCDAQSDHFPGCQNLKLTPLVEGAPNFRQVRHYGRLCSKQV